MNPVAPMLPATVSFPSDQELINHLTEYDDKCRLVSAASREISASALGRLLILARKTVDLEKMQWSNRLPGVDASAPRVPSGKYYIGTTGTK